MCNSRALSRICNVSYFKLQLISQVNFFEKYNFKGALAPKLIRNSLRPANYQFQPKTYFGLTYWASIVHVKILTKVKNIFLCNIHFGYCNHFFDF